MKNIDDFDPTKDTEVIPFEDVTAEIVQNSLAPTDEEVLASFLPVALKDGMLLVELSETKGSDIKHSVILTLNETQCPYDEKPEDLDPAEGIWCWNARRGGWYNLQYARIDAVQPFPPEMGQEMIDVTMLGLE